jgi:N-carbamoylputrescine amidase
MSSSNPTVTADVVPALESPARVATAPRTPLRVGIIQHEWNPDRSALLSWLNAAIDSATAAGAQIVFTPEITLSRYPADTLPRGNASDHAEDLLTGPTLAFAAEAAKRAGVFVQTSLYRTAEGADGLGLNTAILVAPDGALIAATNKLHIPVTAGYFEDKYFREGPAAPEAAAAGLGSGNAYPVYQPGGLDGVRLGLPTCWDEWFPEVARAYSLGGANLVVYPSAIGSEPDHPDFDTEPLWRQVIVGNGIANGLFMVAINRAGTEIKPDGTPGNTFYGSSFVSDPYGRVLAQAPRDRAAVLVVDLELEQREDWLALFPFLATRRPDSYGILTEPRDQRRPFGG